jgi:hypothetical protein
MIYVIADSFIILAGAINLVNAVSLSTVEKPNGKHIWANVTAAFICFVIAMLPI